jgi:predicted acylesterase/phospholipase RssA
MDRQISVAFQGGGARLIGLIAAAHALSELEQSSGVKIRAVSGSSAGSIAALLLAANADFDRAKDLIRKLNPEIKKNFPKLTSAGLYYKVLRFIVTGQSIYKKHDLQSVMEYILNGLDINPNQKLKDIKHSKRLFLMFSDIYSAASEYANEDEIVKTAIMRSCSLPIVFSSYKDLDASQRVDGGLLNNLPTDILMQGNAEICPVFAIGFRPERHSPPSSAAAYLRSLFSSGIQYRIQSSKKAIGEDMVLELDTELDTLDFDKIVDIGLEKEYNRVKAQTRQFFTAYLSGHKNFSDPLSEKRGLAPFFKLKSVEKSIYKYVTDSLEKARCTSKYLKMRVNAFSLVTPSNYDEIHMEQLIEFPDGGYIKGAILTMTTGAGYVANVECHACVGGPDGPEMECEQFFIKDFQPGILQGESYTDVVVLLFKGDLKPLIGKSVYIIKKEMRHGFMLDLRENKTDFLALRSIFWPTDEISITLNVPKEFAALRCEWLRERGAQGPPPYEVAPPHYLVPAGFVCYTQAIRQCGVGTRLKGTFYQVNREIGIKSSANVESSKTIIASE